MQVIPHGHLHDLVRMHMHMFVISICEVFAERADFQPLIKFYYTISALVADLSAVQA